MWVGCAYLGETPIAGGIGFRWGTEFEMTWASSLHSHSRISPNMGLYWAFMERCIQEKVTLFNFGRTTPGSGTHAFKLQWGSREEPLWWYQRAGRGRQDPLAGRRGVCLGSTYLAQAPSATRQFPWPARGPRHSVSLRYLPPAYSPVTLAGLAAGFGALATRRDPRALLQQQLAATYDVSDVLLTDSGTSALGLALRPADRATAAAPVALPGWGCYDLATAADAAGTDVLLYDLLPDTLGPDWDSLERVLAQGVSTVVVVHPFGLPVNMPEVQRRAARHGARLVEDAAQAVGATVGGRLAGATGDLGILSFGRGKGQTGGGGGALLRRAGGSSPASSALAPAGGGAASVIKLAAQWLLARPALYRVPASLPFLGLGQTIYHTASDPREMHPATAAVLSTALTLQARELEARRVHVARLAPVVRDAGSVVPTPWSGGIPGWLRVPVLPSDRMLASAQTPAARALGIVPSYPRALADLPGFDRVRNREAAFPGARDLARRLHSLPVHSLLTHRDLDRLVAWIRGTAAPW